MAQDNGGSWWDWLADNFYDPLEHLVDYFISNWTDALTSERLNEVEDVTEAIGDLYADFKGIMIQGESELQETRVEEAQGSNMYPPDASGLAGLTSSSPSSNEYLRKILDLQGNFRSQYHAMWELARQHPEFATIRELRNRGVIDEDKTVDLLAEAGFKNRIASFTAGGGGGGLDPMSARLVERGDRDDVTHLFNVLPGLSDVVQMDVRDAFPRPPDLHPDWVQDLPQFRHWADGFPDITVRDWEPGADLDGDGEPDTITDTLKQETEYGPQSFASWFLGGRQEYSRAFEAAARANGLDPYWSMKTWEAHWQIPSWRMGRRLLWRSPMITDEMFSTLLRWQDFPPKLINEMTQVSYRPLTRVDVRRMHLRGVLDIVGVYKSYRNFGYNPDNAALMTGFTVTWNADRNYGDIIEEIFDAYAEGAITRENAIDRAWNIIAPEPPEELSREQKETLLGRDWDTFKELNNYSDEDVEELLQRDINALWGAYESIRDQKQGWLRLMFNQRVREKIIEDRQQVKETAHDKYTEWEWTAQEAEDYLIQNDFEPDRAGNLVGSWKPERTRNERLPTRSMLEDFLRREAISMEEWRQYMHRLGYSDNIIEAIMQGQGRLPSRAMVERFLEEGAIGPDKAADYLRQLGYDEDEITRIINTTEWEV